MQREVALRRALQDARDRRQTELQEIQDRGRAFRRRLRELTDRSLALGSVHGRFFPEPKGEPVNAPAPSPSMITMPAPTPAPVVPVTPSAVAPPAPSITPSQLAVSTKRDEEVHGRLLRSLRERFENGFTVGQMREIMDDAYGRSHTYDAAWTLANNLLRGHTIEVAGFRPGEKGPIRVLRVAKDLELPTEVR